MTFGFSSVFRQLAEPLSSRNGLSSAALKVRCNSVPVEAEVVVGTSEAQFVAKTTSRRARRGLGVLAAPIGIMYAFLYPHSGLHCQIDSCRIRHVDDYELGKPQP
jgi:hypothetical protein